ncbi:MAG: hypothetical protein HWQ38_26360 [Nostoc sp. NMS7]|uniref:hypothetical protein n=1 Tax=Nostoc sp. NMS7 TaxID=2815391 RepID=UPI0025E57316|nr:hypothetical protein [Nostoc sp. NMS7]MBN3949797.1 hypothetical protein [Nostoc sp. NMS7]
MQNLEANSNNSESTQSQSQNVGGNGTNSKQSGRDAGDREHGINKPGHTTDHTTSDSQKNDESKPPAIPGTIFPPAPGEQPSSK